MNYDEIQKTLAGRSPIRCYEFKRGALAWLYNTSSESIKRNNMLFQSITGGILDEGIIRSNGSQTDDFTVSAPVSIAIAKLYTEQAPSNRIWLTAYDTDANSDDLKQRWHGAINSVNYSEVDRIKIICIPAAALANKTGATQTYARQCDDVIYDKQCKVNKELYRVEGTIQQIGVNSIQVAKAANYQDGWFNGGFIEFDVGSGELDRRYIEAHQGITLTLWGTSGSFSLGQTINLFAGCNQSQKDHCANKFNNSLNYQGCPHMQGRSPFDGNPVR